MITDENTALSQGKTLTYRRLNTRIPLLMLLDQVGSNLTSHLLEICSTYYSRMNTSLFSTNHLAYLYFHLVNEAPSFLTYAGDYMDHTLLRILTKHYKSIGIEHVAPGVCSANKLQTSTQCIDWEEEHQVPLSFPKRRRLPTSWEN
jgi:hypothetical protein